MKLKYIITLVIVLLIAVFSYQCYWLFHLYHTQKVEFRQRTMDAIEYSDFQELMSRGDNISNKFKATVRLNIDNVNHKRKEGNGKNYFYYYFDPQALKNPGKTLYSLIRNQLHKALDPMRQNNIRLFYTLLSKRLLRYGIRGPIKIEFHYDKDSIMASYSGKHFKPSSSDNHFDYTFGKDQRSFYRVITPSATKVILKEMSGILTGSLLIFLLLVFVFLYLIHTVRNLRTLDEMKSDFTNNMTHELKTPIAVAYAANDALLNFDMTKDQIKTKKYLTIGQQQLRRLSGLVEQILSMSMERRKNMKLNIEEVTIQPILESLIAEQNFKADKTVDISFNIPKNLSIKVDRNHFAHILSNLLDNAIKYSTGKAEIKVAAHKEKNYTEIAIADKGIGIAADNQKYIFDKFYRVPHGNLNEVKGYGLGLYYVKSMMDKFHGNISVKSELGKGTTFKLRFYD
ncbi:MAG: HAMP domain-containing histidine kinase [Prevotella sp.]|jgi:signal transduction histidine kinase|nr:HAMP domain-containing histidine kinase [Prevotella sp.]